jgi:hypothetical protein
LQTTTIIITMKLLRSALIGIGVADVSTRCIAQTCQEIVSGGNRKLNFLKDDAGRGGGSGVARDGTGTHGIGGGTEVRRHQTAVPVFVWYHTPLSTFHVLSKITPQEFLEEGVGGVRGGTDIHGIVGGTEVRRHWTAVPLVCALLFDSPNNTCRFSRMFAQAEVGRYSYIVRLNWGISQLPWEVGALSNPYCGGTLVAPDVVLTAAVSFRFCLCFVRYGAHKKLTLHILCCI